MGCGSSKSLAKSVSTREEFITPLQKKTSGYEEILVSKNATDHQFITLLCTPSTLAKQLKEQESPKQSSPIRNNNATQTESFNSPYPVIEAEESAIEFARTGSLRDWLTQGGQATSNGSHVRAKHGSSEHPGGRRSGNSCEENAFHPDLVAQLEQAMEDLTMEEEEILSHIVEKWEGMRVQ